MINDKKTIAIIPARKGSKGIPKKNLKKINGKPLIQFPVEAALKSKYIDEVWVATDCREICNTALDIDPKVKVYRRSAESASDDANSEVVLLEFARKYKPHGLAKDDFDIMVFLQCTSPLTKAKDIDEALELMTSSTEINTVLSGCVDSGGRFCGGFQWVEEDINAGCRSAKSKGVRVARRITPYKHQRQNAPKYYRENGAFYITEKYDLMKHKARLSGNIRVYEMPQARSYEIDEIEDLCGLEDILNNA